MGDSPAAASGPVRDAGATPRSKDAAGKTALDYTRERTDEAGAAVVTIITQAMG